MKRILLSVDFTPAAGNTLQYIDQLALQMQWKVDLLYCFPVQVYNRAYDFGGLDYAVGIKEMLSDFHRQYSSGTTKGSKYLAMAGSIMEAMVVLKPTYGLLAIGGSKADQEEQILGGRAISVAASVNCPVLIVPPTAGFQKWERIWYIKRTDHTLDRLANRLKFFGINSKEVQEKTFVQKTFYSALWERIVKRSSTTNSSDWDKPLDETIHLIVLVRDQKQTFMNFLRGETMAILYRYQIPILIIPSST